MKQIYINGFWPGFLEKTDGVHFGFFEALLRDVFETDLVSTPHIADADILLESHFEPTKRFAKEWMYTFFFSGEGQIGPPVHLDTYSCVLGVHRSPRHVVCPLLLAYEYSNPFSYTQTITTVPSKPLCSVVSSDVGRRLSDRMRFHTFLESQGLSIDYGGSYKNNIGYKISGQYYQQPLLDFFKTYRVVCAFENTLTDTYISEKVVNPVRAGTIPLYLGSSVITSFLNPNRIVQVDPTDFSKCIPEIQRLLTDDAYWLEKVNQPIFVKPIKEWMAQISADMKQILRV
jgi:hypothetical protein